MSAITRRDALAAAAGLAAGLAGTAAAGRDAIPFGSAAQIETFRTDARYREALRHDRNGFDFSGADEIVGFARQNGQALRGHALLWGMALPPWAKEMSSRAEAERELVHHIETVVDRYKGTIATWDVVNGVIAHEPTLEQPYRDTIWQRLLGPEHIEIAFRTAARVDPKARLVINDYDFEDPDPRIAIRCEAALRIIRRLKDKGISVHELGMQAHLYGERAIDTPGLQQFMRELGRLEIDVEITELDVIDWKLLADPGARDRAAASLVSAFLNAVVPARRPSAIVTWGLSDRYSWIVETFPHKDGAKARPLPLDTEYKPKPMMAALERHRRGTG